MKKLLSLITILVLLSVFASAQTYELHTSNKKPTIIVPFLEESLIDSYELTDGTNPIQAEYTTADNYTYEFTTQEVLKEGFYILTINPSDVLGNPASQPVIINLYVEPVEIKIINPPLEVSQTEIFDVEIETSEKADCRYSTVFPPTSYEDLADSLEKISDKRHKITDFTAPQYPSSKPLWVMCKDSFGYETQVKKFELSVDSTPPKILEAKAEPAVILEYDTNGDKKTTLTVKTDDTTVCKYSTISQLYERMNTDGKDDLTDGFFEGNNETQKTSYKTDNNKILKNLTNNKQYTYYINCKNLAQLTTDIYSEITFSVNLSTEFAITSTNPADGGFIGETSYTLNVSTNKQADCYFSKTDNIDPATSPKMTSQGKTGDYYLFTTSMTGDEGKNKLLIYCKPAASPEIKQINFIIDTTPPTGKEIITENITWITDWLEAELVFDDNESGIAYYEYSITDQFNKIIFENGTSTTPKVKVDKDNNGKKLNLTDLTTYVWHATATNKAGKKSQEITGNIKIDISTKPKDIFPPTITLKTAITSKGTNITLMCSDPFGIKMPSSGCDGNQSFYGLSDTETCTIARPYNGTFTITKAQYLCYSFADKAYPPNIARNTTFVNVSPMIDTDDDGVREGFDECPATPPGEKADENGCSCSQQDEDGDGINNCNDRCANTTISEQALSDGCAETQRDTDKDGMTDKWEDSNGLDKYNAADAKRDDDLDGLNNLDEYKARSDPTIYDTDDDNIADGGERTSGTGITDESSTPPDTDKDRIDDEWENKFGLSASNPADSYADNDNDGLNNLWEYNYNLDPGKSDFDGDCFLDGGEITSGTDPNDPTSKPKDDNGNCVDDRWENKYSCIDPTKDIKQEDSDNDTLTNYQEYLLNTNPCSADTDNDAMPDWWEIKYGLNPNTNDANTDTDYDDFTNEEEYRGATNPRDKNSIPKSLDTDGDGIPDWWEKTKGLNYKDPSDAEQDQDNDGLLSIEEYSISECLEPLQEDTDEDGYSDNKEVQAGTNPCDQSDKPASYWWILILLATLLTLGAAGYFGYKYLYPIIEKKFGRPTLRKWPPFERVVGRPTTQYTQQTARKAEEKKAEEKPKPKTTSEKLNALAANSFDKLSELTKTKTKEEKKEINEAKKAEEILKEGETKSKTETKEKTATERLDEISKRSIDKLEALTKTKPKTAEKPTEKKKTTSFDLLDKIGKAGSRDEIFEALPGKEDIFAELKKATKYTDEHLEMIERLTRDKDVEELVKTFEKLKSQQGTKASMDIFKTLLGHLLKSKKINIHDVQEVLLKLKDEKVFTGKQVSDVLFSLKE